MALSRDAAFTHCKTPLRDEKSPGSGPGLFEQSSVAALPVASIHLNERSQCRAAPSLGSN